MSSEEYQIATVKSHNEGLHSNLVILAKIIFGSWLV